MKLLVVTNNPERASFRQRIGVYLDVLRDNDIECEAVKLPVGSLARRKLFKRAADFDGVFLHRKALNFFDAPCSRKFSKKIMYDFDDATMYSTKTPDLASPSHFWPFRRTVRLADMVIAGNSYLAEHAKKFNLNVKILPTGLDTREYQIKTQSKNDGKIRLVWVGSKSTLPYLAEIKPALEEIGARFGNVILRIICDDFFDLQNMDVEKRRWALETQAADLTSSDIGLAPLPDNRFTRGKCGFKILQYASASLPVIASPVGVNADYVKDAITGFLATNTQQWTSRITQLIENANLRKKMGQKGRNSVQEFDVNLLGKRLINLIKKFLENPAAEA